MFIVKCDAGYNTFFLASYGWTANRQNALTFTTRGAANSARRRSYKTQADKTSIEAA